MEVLINNHFFYTYIFSILILIIILSIFNFFIFAQETHSSQDISEISYIFSNTNFFWPLPGFHRITSNFGYRTSPTSGASSNHSGIDIAAPEGTIIHSILNCKVTFTGFKGAGGYSIITEANEYTISYCHVSPNYIIKVGDTISIGDIIGTVGPKYINSFPGNPYKDSSGKSTNGATTGCHLHLTIKRNGQLIDPLSLF